MNYVHAIEDGRSISNLKEFVSSKPGKSYKIGLKHVTIIYDLEFSFWWGP